MNLLRFVASITATVLVGLPVLAGAQTDAPSDCTKLNPGQNRCMIDTADGPRTFVVVVPQNVNPKAPLLVDAHGFGGSSGAALGSGLVQLVQRAGFVYIAQDGVERSHNGLAGCCGVASQRGIDEVGFIKAAMERVTTALNIQPEARFAHGISNGGDLMNRFACEAADIFDAVQSTSFQFSTAGLASCKPANPIAYQEVHAVADNTIPFNGPLFGTQNAMQAAQGFARIEGCNVAGAVQKRVNSNTTCMTFPGCQSDVVVEMCTVNPGAHSIFPTIGVEGDPVRFVDLSLDFFQRELNRLRRERGSAPEARAN